MLFEQLFTNCKISQKSNLQYITGMDRLQNLSLILHNIAQTANLFSHVEMAPPDVIIGSRIAYNRDTSRQKVNLGVGAYRDNDGQPYVFQVVRKVQVEMINSKANHEYLEIDGLPQFVSGARSLLLGAKSEAVLSNRVASTQTLSGTGAVSLGCSFLAQYLPRIIYVSNPTWPIHKGIAQRVGLKWRQYPYYSSKTKRFDCEAMLAYLEKAVPGSVVILHVCAHNPTGLDPTEDQWKKIAQVMKKNSLLPFFDSAYQGFASGDLDKDAWAVRYFLSQGFQMLIAQSFAKNMGLYGERVGALHIVAGDTITADKILSQLKTIIRQMYSSPSLHGAAIAAKVLNNPSYLQEWKKELKDVVSIRIIKMREALRAELERISAPGTWDHITDQIGMFSYTGLSQKACEILINKYHVYLLKTGRISMAGVNTKNVKYLASSIKSALSEAQQK